MNQKLNQKLKAIFLQRNATIVPGAFNAMTAKMIENEGFEAIYVTGAGLTNAQLGLPDMAFIGLNEIVNAVFTMREVTNIPLIVDADTGFGNAVNVTRTVKALEQAGASAIQLEDQVFPKKCGHFEMKEVLDKNEASEKIRAAVDARQDHDLMIIARTDARDPLGFEAAIERAQVFVESGADITFVESPRTVEEIREIPRCINVPQVINLVSGGKTPMLEKKDLALMGYGVALYANAALQSAMLAIQKTLQHLIKHGSLSDWNENLINFIDRQKIVNKDYFDAIEAKYSKDKVE